MYSDFKWFPFYFASALRGAGVSLAAVGANSLSKQVYRVLRDDSQIKFLTVTDEAELPGIAAGAYLAGGRAVVAMDRSGLRKAYDPLAHFALTHQVPMVAAITCRDDTDDHRWWSDSHLTTMEPMLASLSIPHWFVRRVDDIHDGAMRAWIHAESAQRPVALLLADQCAPSSPPSWHS